VGVPACGAQDGAAYRPVAPGAQSRFFTNVEIGTTIINMALFRVLIQTVTDWIRGTLADILGRRAEASVDKWLKKRRARRSKKSRKKERL
jgi:hypothetical protein